MPTQRGARRAQRCRPAVGPSRAPAPAALPHYSSRQPPRRAVTRLGRRRRWPGWSEGASGGESAAHRAPAPSPLSLSFSLARVYAAPQRSWDPGSSECPPGALQPPPPPPPLAGPQEGGRALESEKGTSPPSVQLPVRPRGRDPGRACRPRGRARKRGRKEGEECFHNTPPPHPPRPAGGPGKGGGGRAEGPEPSKPDSAAGPRGGALPRPPCPEEGRRAPFPALRPGAGLWSALFLPVFWSPCGSA